MAGWARSGAPAAAPELVLILIANSQTAGEEQLRDHDGNGKAVGTYSVPPYGYKYMADGRWAMHPRRRPCWAPARWPWDLVQLFNEHSAIARAIMLPA